MAENLTTFSGGTKDRMASMSVVFPAADVDWMMTARKLAPGLAQAAILLVLTTLEPMRGTEAARKRRRRWKGHPGDYIGYADLS
jgi:hypothetical protein